MMCILVIQLTIVYKSFYVLIPIVMIENVNAKLLKVLTCVHIVLTVIGYVYIIFYNAIMKYKGQVY